jgi:hypothetical protein
MQSFVQMIMRVESNLSLICSAGKTVEGTNHPYAANQTTTDSINSIADNASENKSLFLSPFGSQFDKYYLNLFSLLLKLILDEPFTACSEVGIDALLNWKGCTIRNHAMLLVILHLFESPSVALITIAIRLATILIRINPMNAVLLARENTIAKLFFVVKSISASGYICGGPNYLISAVISPTFHLGPQADILLVLNETLTLIEMVTLFFMRKDELCLHQLLITGIEIMQESGDEDSIPTNHSGADYQFDSMRLCSNCEIEPAALECLNEK